MDGWLAEWMGGWRDSGLGCVLLDFVYMEAVHAVLESLYGRCDVGGRAGLVLAEGDGAAHSAAAVWQQHCDGCEGTGSC